MTTALHPQNFSIQIERVKLKAYLQRKWFLCWVCSLGGCGLLAATIPTLAALDKGQPWTPTSLIAGASLFAGALLLATIFYFLFSHRTASRYANGLELRVEGPFLRVIEYTPYRIDRKLHFRALNDYATLDGPLLSRHGLQILYITTTGGVAARSLSLPGIKNCLQVRDMLAEIDAQRENA